MCQVRASWRRRGGEDTRDAAGPQAGPARGRSQPARGAPAGPQALRPVTAHGCPFGVAGGGYGGYVLVGELLEAALTT